MLFTSPLFYCHTVNLLSVGYASKVIIMQLFSVTFEELNFNYG